MPTSHKHHLDSLSVTAVEKSGSEWSGIQRLKGSPAWSWSQFCLRLQRDAFGSDVWENLFSDFVQYLQGKKIILELSVKPSTNMACNVKHYNFFFF